MWEAGLTNKCIPAFRVATLIIALKGGCRRLGTGHIAQGESGQTLGNHLKTHAHMHAHTHTHRCLWEEKEPTSHSSSQPGDQPARCLFKFLFLYIFCIKKKSIITTNYKGLKQD